MSQPIEIKIIATKSGTGLEESAAQVDRLSKGIKQADVNLGEFAHSEAFGLSHREFGRIAMGAIVAADAIGGLDKQTSQLVHTGEQVASAFLFGGPLGAAVTVAAIGIGALVGEMQKVDAEAKSLRDELIKPFTDTREALAKLADVDNPLARIAATIPMTKTELQKLAESSQFAAKTLLQLNDAQATSSLIAAQQKAAQAELSDALRGLAIQEDNLKNTHLDPQITAEHYAAAKDRYDTAALALNNLSVGLIASKQSESDLRDKVVNLSMAFKDGAAAGDYYARVQLAIAAAAKIAGAAMREEQAAAIAAANKIAAFMQGAVTSAVGEAIKPTAVSKEDERRNELLAQLPKLYQKANEAVGQGKPGLLSQTNSQIDAIQRELTALGPYEEKWDELARQSDIIVRDGDKRLAEFPKLSDAMQKTGLDAKHFGEQFRSGAVFADIKPEKLLGGTGGGIEKAGEAAMMKLKETIGTKHLSDAVSKEVWAKMPDAMRKELAQMGIENLTDAEKVQLGVRKANDFDASLKAIHDAILGNIPPEMYTTIHATWVYDAPAAPPGSGYIAPPAPPKCFVGDTLIDTPAGLCRIADLNAGDRVLVYDPNTQSVFPSMIVETTHSQRSDLVTVKTESGFVAHCSPNHRWLTSDGWVIAEHLLVGDALICADREDRVASVSPYPGEFDVYNLTVQHHAHTYLVQGHVVHNAKISQQSGGMGTLMHDQLFYAHAGEDYWFSGTNRQVPPPGNVSINISGVTVSNERDIMRLAREVAREIRRHQ